MPKIEIEVPENDYKFLKALSNFTGQPVNEIIQGHVDMLPEAILGSWPEILGATMADLKARYKLE